MDFPSLMQQNYGALLPTHPSASQGQPTASGEPGLLHRTSSAPATPRAAGRIERLVNWLENAYWRQVIKSREAYLAKSQNLSELESRMQQLDLDVTLRYRSMP
ncbi:MAG: DUF3563 family protein [Burkholderiales bacterium]|nr:DUF3563 family protein [Burkholderiales bacterium]